MWVREYRKRSARSQRIHRLLGDCLYFQNWTLGFMVIDLESEFWIRSQILKIDRVCGHAFSLVFCTVSHSHIQPGMQNNRSDLSIAIFLKPSLSSLHVSSDSKSITPIVVDRPDIMGNGNGTPCMYPILLLLVLEGVSAKGKVYRSAQWFTIQTCDKKWNLKPIRQNPNTLHWKSGGYLPDRGFSEPTDTCVLSL